MSIPHSFDPMGTTGGGRWTPLDMSAFASSTWAEGELNPLGSPASMEITTRNCTRSAREEILFFGYRAASTTYTANYYYGSTTTPPRRNNYYAAPALELWRTGDAVAMRVTAKLSRAVVRACCTVDEWQTWTTLPVADNGDGTYTVATPPCRAVSIHCEPGNYYINGTITQIEIWK